MTRRVVRCEWTKSQEDAKKLEARRTYPVEKGNKNVQCQGVPCLVLILLSDKNPILPRQKQVFKILQGQVTKCADALKPQCETDLDMVMLDGLEGRQAVRCMMANIGEVKK